MNYELPSKYWEERDPHGKKVEVKEFDYFDWALAKEKYHMRQHLER